MDKFIPQQFVEKLYQSGKYALVIAIFSVSLSYFGYFSISPKILSPVYFYLMVNGSAAGAIIYRGHQVFATQSYCPKCRGALELLPEYKCPTCGILSFKK